MIVEHPLTLQWRRRYVRKAAERDRLMALGLSRDEANAQVANEQARAVKRAVEAGARLQDIGDVLGMTREAVRQWKLQAEERRTPPLSRTCDEGVTVRMLYAHYAHRDGGESGTCRSMSQDDV